MKRYIIFLFILLPLISFSQITGDYRTAQSGNWSDAATWQVFDGTNWVAATQPPDQNANTTTIQANHTVNIDANAQCNNLIVDANGSLQTASGVTATLTVYGNFTNNGNVDFYTSSSENVLLVFAGTTNASFTTGSANTDIYQITVDKAYINDTVVLSADNNFLIQGQNSNAPGYLNLNRGTFKISGTVSLSAYIFASSTTSITINDDERLWLDNPNFTVRPLSGSLTVYGELRVSQGTFNVTNTQNRRLIIENHGTYRQDGGIVNIEGAFYAGPNDTVNVIITGGILNVALSQPTTSYYYCFRIGNAASQFTMSGGTINLVNTNSAGIEYHVASATQNTNITGGTLNIGTDATAADFEFEISGQMPNLVVDNTNNVKTAHIEDITYVHGNAILNGNLEFNDISTDLYVYGDLIINTGAYFSVYPTPGGLREDNLHIFGSIIADGDFDGFVDNAGNIARMHLYFEGTSSATVSGAGNVFEVYTITMNKTGGMSPIVEILRNVDLIPAVASSTYDHLIINGGTLKISADCQWTAYSGEATVCTQSGRLWLNSPNALIQGLFDAPGPLTVNGEIVIDNGTLHSYGDVIIETTCTDSSRINNGSLIVGRILDLEKHFIINGGNVSVDSSLYVDGNNLNEDGKLTVNSGILTVGNGDDHLRVFGDVNGTDGFGGDIVIHGGQINLFGHLTVDNGSAQEQCTFTMDGGVLRIDPQATRNFVNNDLVIINTNAIVNFTGGTIIFVDPVAQKDEVGDEELDINGDGTKKNFAGSTIRFGDGTSDAAGSSAYPGFRINVSAGIRLGNLIFDNPSTSTYRAGFLRSDIICDTLIITQASDTLLINGNTLTVTGDFTNNGLVDGTASGSHLVFNGSVKQTFSGTGIVKDNLQELTFNNSSADGVFLQSDLGAVKVNLTNGKVHTAASPNGLLTVYGTATTDLTVSSGQVISYLRRAVPSSASGDNYVFPVASATALRQLEFMDLTTGGTGSGFITVMVSEPQNPAVNGTAGNGLASPLNAKDIYWKMSFDLGNVTISSSPTLPKVRLTYDVSSETAPFCIAQSNNDINGTYNSIGRIISSGTIKSETFDLTSNGGLVPTGDAYLLIAQVEPIQGTLTVGQSGDVLNLTEIADTLRKNFIKGQVVFELLSDYDASTETVPVVFDVIQKVNPTDAVLIRPQAGVSATQTVLSGSDSAIIYFKGVNSIRFDGRPGGSGASDWLIANNNLPAGWVFEFTDGARYDTLSYLTIKSDVQNTARGVIHFSGTSKTQGNTHNVVMNCDITGNSTTPIIGITSVGDVNYHNDSNEIVNNNIYDFFSATENPYGVYLASNSNAWIIKGNRFYQTASRSFSQEQYYVPIQIDCGVGHLIDGNIIGYADNSGNGKTTISGFTSHFVGIWLDPDNGAQTQVINNHIDGIDFSSSYAATSGPGVFTGIYVPAGNSADIQIGTQTQGNVIGSTSVTDQIIISSENGSASYGIKYDGNRDIQILGNTIAGIRVKGLAADDDIRFYGIYNDTRALTIRYNSIGASGVVNSIQLGENGITTGATYFWGIYNNPDLPVNISDNTICNVSGYGTAARGYFTGVYFASGGGVVNNNKIFNLKTLSQWSGTVGTPTICGIRKNSSTQLVVSNNEIFSLGSDYNANVIVRIAGISIGSSNVLADTISANFIHNLYNNPANNEAIIYGIVPYAGNIFLYNNMIALGYMPDGTDISTPTQMTAIYDLTPDLGYYYNNSVFIGGQNVADGSWHHTFCYYKEGTNYSTIKNNLFINKRSNLNTTSSSNHFSVSYSNDEVVLSDYNIYFVNGTGGVLFFVDGQSFTTLRSLRAYGNHDFHSGVGDPQFANPAGDAANCDLHISSTANTPVEGTGLTIAGITTDFDGQTRSSLTPADIGADAGNFNFNASVDIFTPNFDYTPIEPQICGTNSVTIDVTITDQGTGVPASGANVPRVYYRDKSQPWSTASSSAGTLISGDGNNGVWRFTLSGLINGVFYEYYFVAQDQASSPNLWYSKFDEASPVHSDVNTPITYPDNNVPIDLFTVCVYTASQYYIGNSTDCPSCDFDNLTGYDQLFYNLNSMIIDKDVTCYIAANTDEPATYGLRDFKYENGVHRIIIKPVDTTTVEKVISVQSTVNKPLIRFDGADSITIDGQLNNDGNRWIVFKHYNDDQPVLQFVNDASYDTVRYCQIRGSGKLDPRGIVFFDTTNVVNGNGNDHIVITHNFITNQGQPPLNAIYSYGSDTKTNSDNEISYNIIGNFKMNGINITPNGNGNNWIIDHNIIYNSYVGDSLQSIIRVEAGENHSITYNLLGGSNEKAGGNPTENNGNREDFYAIYLDVGTGQATTVQADTIRNVYMSYNGGWRYTYGIYVKNGLVNITGNVIDSIATNRDEQLYGVYYQGVSTGSISNNRIARLIHNGSSDIVGMYLLPSDITSSITVSNNTFTGLKHNNTTSTAADMRIIDVAAGNANIFSNTFGGTNASDKIDFYGKGNFYGIYVHSDDFANNIVLNTFNNIQTFNASIVRIVYLGNTVDNTSFNLANNSFDNLSLWASSEAEIIYLTDGGSVIASNTFGNTGQITFTGNSPAYAIYATPSFENYSVVSNIFSNLDAATDLTVIYADADNGRTVSVANNIIRNINSSNDLNFKGIQLYTSSSGQINASGNQLYNITLSGANSSFTGIELLDGNITLGGATSNEIGLATNNISVAGPTAIGILVNNASGNAQITGNKIGYIDQTSTAALAYIAGIATQNAGMQTVKGNTIQNLTTTSQKTDISDGILAIQGILLQGTGTQTIDSNYIYSLSANSSAAINLAGITENAQTPVITRNRIYALTNSSSGGTVSGVVLNKLSSGYVANNMISLGADDATEYSGIWIPQNNTAVKKIYFNSVYIGGNATGGNSYAFLRGNNSTPLYLRNNIFDNERSGSGKHYAIANLNTADWDSTYIFATNYYSANTSTVGLWGTTDCDFATWTAYTKENAYYKRTFFLQPNFVNPAVADLHLNDYTNACVWNSVGEAVADVSTDYDGDTRSANPDIGADEFSPTGRSGDYVWRGWASASWDDPNNWQCQAVPPDNTVTENIIVPKADNQPVIDRGDPANPVVINALTILADASMTINPSSALTLKGALILDGQLILETPLNDSMPTATLIDNGTITGTGKLIAKRFINAKQWHEVSAPVISSDATSAVFTRTNPSGNFNPNFYYYDETVDLDGNPATEPAGVFDSQYLTKGWKYAHNGAFGADVNLQENQGYLFWTDANQIITFQGKPATGNYDVSNLSYTQNDPDDDGDAVPDLYDGWHLLGNPYPSYIDWDLIRDNQISGVDDGIYIWDDGQYAGYKNGVSVMSGNLSNLIPPMQGFFVHVNNATNSIQIRNEHRTHGSQKYLKRKTVITDLIKLRTSANGVDDYFAVYFEPDATPSYDEKYDLVRMFTNRTDVPQLYAFTNDGDPLSLAALPQTDMNDCVVPLGLAIGENSACEISVDKFTGLDNIHVYLRDKLLDSLIDLRAVKSYKFTAQSGRDDNRFELIFGQNTPPYAVKTDTFTVISYIPAEIDLTKYFRDADALDTLRLTPEFDYLFADIDNGKLYVYAFAEDTGFYPLDVRATDRLGKSTSARFYIRVLANRPPDLSMDSKVYYVEAGKEFSVPVEELFRDPDPGDKLTVSVNVDSTGWLRFDGKRFYGKPMDYNKQLAVVSAVDLAKNQTVEQIVFVPFSDDLLLYPNPADKEFTVIFRGQQAVLQIFDLNGRLLWEKTVASGQRISAKFLAAGTYIVKLKNSNEVKRLIKK